jgi:diacylglycerol kinase
VTEFTVLLLIIIIIIIIIVIVVVFNTAIHRLVQFLKKESEKLKKGAFPVGITSL